MKGLSWSVQLLEDGRPDLKFHADRPDAYRGQWVGMRVQLNRLLFGLLHELLVTIETHIEVLAAHPWCTAAEALDGEGQDGWLALVDVATRAEETDDLRNFLVRVRNNAVFHYYNPKDLANGYTEHFARKPRQPITQSAYVSLGPSMENTRFFFADAAVQSAITRIDPDGDLAGTQPYIQAANAALRGLVAEYIRLRIEEHRASSVARSRRKLW